MRRHDQHHQAGLHTIVMLLGAQKWTVAGIIGSVRHLIYFLGHYTNVLVSSDASSGVIRLYDGRGQSVPLEIISSVHRFPVSVMTVSPQSISLYFETLNLFSTPTATTVSYPPTNRASSSTGNQPSHSACQKASPSFGNTRATRICTSSRRHVIGVACWQHNLTSLYSRNLHQPASPSIPHPHPSSPFPSLIVKFAYFHC